MNFFFFLLVVFLLPVNRQLFTIALWPWLFTWIIEGGFRDKFIVKNVRENMYALLFLVGLFLLNLLSILWSSDKSGGFNQLGIQASLIIFPVFLSFSNKVYRQEKSFKIIMISFCSGIITVSFFLLLKAIVYSVSLKNGQLIFNPVINEWENVFLFSQFSFLIHPTYLGIMVLLATSVCIIDLREEVFFNNKSLLKILIISFFYFIIFLISSKAIILASVITGLWLLISLIPGKKNIIPASIIVSIAIIILLGTHPRISQYIENYKNKENKSLTSIDIRFKIWESSVALIKENPIAGVGMGDVKNRLEVIYETRDYGFPATFNSHNQFLEQWLSSGLVSMLFLLAALILPLISLTIKLPSLYYQSFFIICGFAFIFESILCRFWGVAFFSIFYTLLTRRTHPE